jgi:DNA-binding transcriptional ArsR family regulator
VRALKAMAHPARLRMLAMLTTGELCVCQMTAVLDLAASTVSGHLADLRSAGLVSERKAGKWVHYQLTDDRDIAAVVASSIALLATDHQTHADAVTVRRVRRIPAETLSSAGFHLVTDPGAGRKRAQPSTVPRRSATRRVPAV